LATPPRERLWWLLKHGRGLPQRLLLVGHRRLRCRLLWLVLWPLGCLSLAKVAHEGCHQLSHIVALLCHLLRDLLLQFSASSCCLLSLLCCQMCLLHSMLQDLLLLLSCLLLRSDLLLSGQLGCLLLSSDMWHI
jgi:hypothetical protein